MLLTLAIFLPLLGAGLVLLLPKDKTGLIRWVSTGVATATFVPVLLLTIGYGGGDGRTVVETFDEEISAALQEIPAGLRPRAESLLEEPVVYTPELLESAAQEGEDESLREARGTLEELQEAGAFGSWRRAWELTAARDSSMAEDMRYVTFAEWIPTFNINYILGVDGLSMPLIFLTALLWILCCLYSFNVEKGVKAYYALFLVLETGLIGVFAALDFFLFYVFWEVVLLPMYFLIGYWGGPRRIYAAIKFFIYTLAGSVLMLVAMLALYWKGGYDTFNILTLSAMAPGFELAFQAWIWTALFIGFAIKVPVFPFHTWLPDAHVQAPTAVSMVLAGVLLKMGGYGFFRFNYSLTPGAMAEEAAIMVVALLGVVNIVYGALVAMAQRDFKSLVAYSSISHMGYVLLGMAALTQAGVQGAVLQMFNHGLSSAMLFCLVGVIYDRAHHRDLNNFGGLGLHMPYYTGFAVIGFFASLGLPGLNGFISEFTTLLGAYDAQEYFSMAGASTMFALPRWVVYLALPGIVLTAAYILWAVQRVYLGEPKKEEYKTYKDLSFRETFVLAPLAVLCIVLGVFPEIILDYMDATLHSLRTIVTLGR